ncbi:hypothetical protein BVC80_9065g110 [Macleaya cordata]|uniref:Uncharacterized protein n=1 Tax=Macleaya cordata TaxID=56857 RepID=A0A200PNQ5_MACCD|nr:hypothetical protein BVC80_9065g110 [Macleaya cordata]
MSFFAHEEEEPKHPSSKTFNLFRAAMKEAFGQCCAFRPSSSTLNIEEEYSVSDIDDEQEVVILAIRTRAMEAKLRRKKKGCSLTTQSFRWVLTPMNTTGELIISAPNPKLLEQQQQQQQQLGDNEEEQEDDDEKEFFFSAGSCFSRCSSASKEVFFSAGSCFSHCSSASREVFLSSARSCLSRCSSARVIDFSNVNGRRLIMEEFCHCEGWPFGLCRKAMLLPPLPKSPSESWSWRGAPHMVKTLK